MRRKELEAKHFPMNLQLFGHDGGDGGNGSGAGGDGQDGKEDKPDKDGDGGEPGDENGGDPSEDKKYSDKDLEATVQKRLTRERRKWQREQKRPPSGKSTDDGGEDEDDDSEAAKKTRKAEERAAALEMKWTCLDHGVSRDCVDDVLALAMSVLAKDEDMDIEDAIDKVLKKYPQFKDGYEPNGDEPDGKKGWGQRHGKPPAKTNTVEDEIRKQMFGK